MNMCYHFIQVTRTVYLFVNTSKVVLKVEYHADAKYENPLKISEKNPIMKKKNTLPR